MRVTPSSSSDMHSPSPSQYTMQHSCSENSLFGKLGSGTLRRATKALKKKLQNSSDSSDSIAPVLPKAKLDRFQTYRKELFVCLRYLEDVVLKRNVFTLAGSATMLLNVVLKIVLLFNEKHRELKQSSVNMNVYKMIYQHLADLLQYVDQILIECSFDVDKKFTISEFCQNLKNTVKVLYELSGESWTDAGRDSSKPIRPLLCENTFDKLSTARCGSTSSDMADRQIAKERNGCGDGMNDETSDGAFPSPSHADVPPPKPPYNPALLEVNFSKKENDKFRSSDISVSPHTTDSGVYSNNSTNNDDLSVDSCSAIPACSLSQSSSFEPQANGDGASATFPLDELLTKLNLNSPCFFPSDSATASSYSTNEDDTSSNRQVSEQLVDGKLVKTTKVIKKQVWKSTVVKHGEATISLDDELLKNPAFLQSLVAAGNGEVKMIESRSQLIRGNAFCEAAAEISGENKFPTQHLALDDGPVVAKSPAVATLKHDDRPVSKYENTSSSSPHVDETVNVSLRAMKMESSHETYSNKTFVNGNLASESQMDQFDSNVVATKQHNIYENGNIVDSTSSSVFARSDGFYRGDANGVSFRVSCTGGQKSSSKRNIVCTYMQVFGSSNPSSESDFRNSALVTYERLRDRWQLNLESSKRRGLPFDFRPAALHGSSVGSGLGSSAASNELSPSADAAAAGRRPSDQWSAPLSQEELLVSESQVFYRNMMELIDLNDKLNLPLMAVCGPQERKPIVLPRRQAISYGNLLDELEVPDHLIIFETNDDATELKGGPADALIVCAASIGNSKGFRYQEAFITTYRTFISPLDVLTKLVYRYERFSLSDNPAKKKAAKNCFSLLVRILDDLSTIEFSEDILVLLRDFIYRMINNGELNLGRLLHQRFVEKLHEKINGSFASSRQPTFMQLYTPERIKNISILDFKSSALAEQITYVDWFYFQKIELSEMLLWAQHQSEEHCPNLTAFTEHFNKMSYWVRTKILLQNDQKEREKYFAKFTKIMRCLRRHGNFNSCLAMLSALDSGPIRRLNWPKSLLEPLADQGALVDSSQSFKAYRTALSEAKPPCLPYIGLILQDLTFVHVGNPDYLYDSHWPNQKDVVNFSKRWQQYTILDNMRRFKTWQYTIQKNDQILAYFNNFDDVIDEEEMWIISEQLKPRGVPPKRS